MVNGAIIEWLQKNPGKSFLDYLDTDSEAKFSKPSLEDMIEAIIASNSNRPLNPS